MHRAVSVTPRGHRPLFIVSALSALIVASTAAAQQGQTPPVKSTAQGKTPASAATLERIKAAGKIKLGYLTDTRPFSYKDESGNPAGFSVAVCQKVADAVKAEPNLSGVSVEWVPVTLTDRFNAVQNGQVDLLCVAGTETLSRRQEVDFSIPVFPGGIGALVRTDAPTRLREILSGRPPKDPTWRASAGALVQTQAFAVVSGTTSETWLNGKLKEFNLTAKVNPVESFDAGIQAVLDRKADVFFTDRAVLLDAMKRNPSASKLVVLDRYFTYESLRFAMKRGDDDFRLVVDRALSNAYRSGDLVGEYTKNFGTPDDKARTFYEWITLPE